MNEAERIRQVYEARDRGGKRATYTLLSPAQLLAVQQRERTIVAMTPRSVMSRLGDLSILDVGCGNASVLRDFGRLGARPELCHGIDLLPFRIEEARTLSPNMHLVCGNGERLEYEDAAFEMVLCFTVFSSILDVGMKQNLSQEIQRVLKPGGVLVWYDFLMDNPKNPDVRGVGKTEIRRLFPGFAIELKRITLAPPVARAIAPVSILLCQILEKLPLLCTHYLGVVRKPHVAAQGVRGTSA